MNRIAVGLGFMLLPLVLAAQDVIVDPAVLFEPLGDGGEVLLGFLGTRYSLRMAMLETE